MFRCHTIQLALASYPYHLMGFLNYHLHWTYPTPLNFSSFSPNHYPVSLLIIFSSGSGSLNKCSSHALLIIHFDESLTGLFPYMDNSLRKRIPSGVSDNARLWADIVKSELMEPAIFLCLPNTRISGAKPR